MTRLSNSYEVLFYNPTWVARKEDLHGVTHGLSVTRFLHGKTKIKISPPSVSHKHGSAPSRRSTQYHERRTPFSPLSVSHAEILHARPSLFTWATNLVANQVHHGPIDLPLKIMMFIFVSLLSTHRNYRLSKK